MKQTLFYLVCLLAVATLIAGCTGTQPQKTAQPSATAVQAAAQAAIPTGTATITTPSVVTVGAPPSAAPPATVTPTPSKTHKPTATQKYAPSIKTSNYVKTINNPYFPLTPGTTYMYNGTQGDSQQIIEIVVTQKIRKIMGVTCVEVDSTVTEDDKLDKKIIDWYAQDKQGNVWFFGEDAKQYNTSGKVTGTTGSWLAGSKGGLPGIVMQANPTTDLSYRQEYYKGHAEDMAQVLSLTESIKVTNGSYDNVLMSKEWSPLDAKVVENKWYAHGVGLVMSKTVQGGDEEMQLTSVTH